MPLCAIKPRHWCIPVDHVPRLANSYIIYYAIKVKYGVIFPNYYLYSEEEFNLYVISFIALQIFKVNNFTSSHYSVVVQLGGQVVL